MKPLAKALSLAAISTACLLACGVAMDMLDSGLPDGASSDANAGQCDCSAELAALEARVAALEGKGGSGTWSGLVSNDGDPPHAFMAEGSTAEATVALDSDGPAPPSDAAAILLQAIDPTTNHIVVLELVLPGAVQTGSSGTLVGGWHETLDVWYLTTTGGSQAFGFNVQDWLFFSSRWSGGVPGSFSISRADNLLEGTFSVMANGTATGGIPVARSISGGTFSIPWQTELSSAYVP